MTRTDAIQLIDSVLATRGLDKVEALNEKNVGGMELPDAKLYFEYGPATGTLRCSAFIENFREPLKPDEWSRLKAKETEASAGGGQLDYQTENHGLFLTRVYDLAVPPAQFVADMERLMVASMKWEDEYLDEALFGAPL